MIPIVLLPGMDGTGELFAKFAALLGNMVQPRAIRYPVNIPQSLESLVEYVESVIPESEPFFLLAESFSGRIAFEVARRQKGQVIAIVFVATFLMNPRPLLLQFRALLPFEWAGMLQLPNWVVRRYFLGLDKPDCDVQYFKQIITQVQPRLLKQRLSMIANLSIPEGRIDMPVLYLQATEDLLVTPKSCGDFDKCCQNFTIKQIKGKHFLLQSSPELSADYVQDFLSNVLHSRK